MIGVGDVGTGGRETRAFLLNHTSVYDLADSTVAGGEVNIRSGRGRSALTMPQAQEDIGQRLQLQAGLGATRHEADAWRPRIGARLIRQL